MATVLIVDDRSINREFLSVLLGFVGHRVIEAADGREALACVLAERPALVITDLMMPVMDGLELTRRLRNDPTTAEIPVIFYTATYRVHEARELARASGANLVLPKPSDPQAILDAVATILGPPAVSGFESAGLTATVAASAGSEKLALQRHLQQRLDLASGGDPRPAIVGLQSGQPRDSAVDALSLRMAALLELGISLSSERDPQRLLELFCRAAQDIVGARLAAVLMRDSGQTLPSHWAASGLSGSQCADLARVDLDNEGPLGRLLRADQPQRLQGLDGDPTRFGLPASHPPFEVLLGAAIRSQSGTAGVLYFADKAGGAPFSEDDEQFAAVLSAQLDLAYGNLKLFDDLQRHAGELQLEIIERRRVADELHESETRFRQVLENLHEAVFLHDPVNNKTLYVSPAYELLWGRSLQSIYADPLSWISVVHPDDREQVKASLPQSQSSGEIDNEYRIVRDDGSQRTVKVRGFPIRDQQGAIQRIVGIAEDVTDARQAADALKESKRRFDTMLDNVELLALMIDGEGCITYCNDFMLSLTGWRREDVLGRDWFDNFLPRETVAEIRAVFGSLLADLPGAWHYENEILTRAGERRLIRWNNTVLRSGSGAAIGTASIGEDITEHRRAQAAVASSATLYQQMFDSNPFPMWVYDTETLGFLAVNDAAVEHYGYSRERFLAMSIADIRPEEDVAALHRSARSHGPGIEHAGVWRHRRQDGSIIRVEIASHAMDFSGRPAKLVLANDVTARLEQECKIERLSRIRAVIGGISSAMLRSKDRNGLLHEACRVAVAEGVYPMAWVSAVDPQTRRIEIVAAHAVDPGEIGMVTAALLALPDDLRPVTRVARERKRMVIDDFRGDRTLQMVGDELLRVGYRSGAAFPLVVGGEVVAVLALLSRESGSFDADELALLDWLTADLSFALEHIENARRLDYLAYYDAVTGLPNARLFGDRLDQFIHGVEQDAGQVCVLVLDLERFTQINDAIGRGAADGLLHDIGARLGQFLAEPCALSRIAADTFAVASPRDDGLIATLLLDQLMLALNEPFVVDGDELRISAQVGIALYPGDGNDGRTVFQNAEAALKLAKASGERHLFHSSEMNARIAHRIRLEAQMRDAVEARQFVLRYQPRVDMISGAVVGAEALIRWQHPELGLLPPADFVHLAEETGLIVPIGAWVIQTVCAQQAAWLKSGLAVVPIAVNLSSVQFQKTDLLKTVRDALQANAVEARFLDLELTESAVMSDTAVTGQALHALREMGVGLALDDFGTGYSSLAYLKRFPFNAVKIDRSFVYDITTNAEGAAIASAIIAMAHQLKLKVVAEGIETQGQFNFLRAQRCDEMQGFFFSAAVSSSEFESFLSGSRRMLLPQPDAGDQPTVLLVDDDSGVRSALTRVLRRDGYRILAAASGAEGLELLALNAVQVIVSDQRMAEMSGTEFLNIARQLYPDTMRIILSGYTDLEVVTDAVNRGSVFKFLTKPWDDEMLREQVRDAFRRHRVSH